MDNSPRLMNKGTKAAIIAFAVICMTLTVSQLTSDLGINFICGYLFGSLGMMGWIMWTMK